MVVGGWLRLSAAHSCWVVSSVSTSWSKSVGTAGSDLDCLLEYSILSSVITNSSLDDRQTTQISCYLCAKLPPRWFKTNSGVWVLRGVGEEMRRGGWNLDIISADVQRNWCSGYIVLWLCVQCSFENLPIYFCHCGLISESLNWWYAL